MKVKPEHYATIVGGFREVRANNPEIERLYHEAGLTEKRMRWDILRAARINGDSSQWLCDVIYPYANDDHIDTALRHAVKDSL